MQKLDGNKLLPNIRLLGRLVCILVSKFGKRLNSDFLAKEAIAQMERPQNALNTFASLIQESSWYRCKLPFTKFKSTHVFDFPEMTENELK